MKPKLGYPLLLILQQESWFMNVLHLNFIIVIAHPDHKIDSDRKIGLFMSLLFSWLWSNPSVMCGFPVKISLVSCFVCRSRTSFTRVYSRVYSRVCRTEINCLHFVHPIALSFWIAFCVNSTGMAGNSWWRLSSSLLVFVLCLPFFLLLLL